MFINTYCIYIHIYAHIHTHKCVCVGVYTYISFPVLEILLQATVAQHHYFSHHTSERTHPLV